MASAKVSQVRREFQGVGDERTASITYRVSSTTPALTLPTENVVLAQQGLPALNAAHPSVGDMRVVDRRVELVRDSAPNNFTWDVTYDYLPVSLIIPDGGGPEAETESNVNLSFRQQWVDAWRSDDNQGASGFGFEPLRNQGPGGVGTNPSLRVASAGTNVDIGGVPVDSKGEPTSVANYFQALDVVQFTGQGAALLPIIQDLVGSRNHAQWFGWELGSVLYLGADLTGSIGSSRVRIVHHFMVDDNYHLRQIPFRLSDGRPQLGAQATIEGSNAGNEYPDTACPVFWVQPYMKLRDFTTLRLGQGAGDVGP
jgi:hypothetical protein